MILVMPWFPRNRVNGTRLFCVTEAGSYEVELVADTDAACSDIAVVDESMIIQSPNYATGTYDNNANCEWAANNPYGVSTISLKTSPFTQIRLPSIILS